MPTRSFGYVRTWYTRGKPTRRSAAIRGALLIGAEALEQRLLLSGAAQLFVTSDRGNTVGEYTTSGATVNASLVSGLNGPQGVAVSGSDLFVSNTNGDTIGEYTTSGATVNASLISGLAFPQGIAISGSDLFVANSTSGTVGEYTTSGATVNAALVSGLSGPIGIVVSGSDLFVTNTNLGTIGEYTTSGATVNPTLISGLFAPEGIAISGPDLFVTNNSGDSIGEYTTSGATVNAVLIQGISNLFGIAISGSDLFVANYTSGTILEYTTSGAPVNTSLVTGVLDPLAIAVASSGPASPPGSADPTFNGGNPVNVGFAAQASVVLPGGQTLLAGLEPGASAGSTQAVLEQLNADGSIDTSFGSAGIVTDPATSDEAFYGVVTESNGTIVAAGASNGDLLLAGYNPDGSVDTSFGDAGRVTVPINGATDAVAYRITTDTSGDIIVVGSAGGQFLADRFTANGVQDPAFNGGAPLLFGAASNADALGNVAVQANGGIVAAGASAGNVVVVRLTSGGALDPTFGAAGVVTLSQLAAPDLLPGLPDHTEGLTIDSEGRILVANTSTGGDFATARLTPAGSLDPTFGGSGVVMTGFGGTADADFVAVQPDGSQIVVAGTSAVGGVAQEAIAAYTPAGLLDTSFGNNTGKELLPISLGATPALLHPPSRQPGPQAEGGGTILQEAFGSLVDGKLVLGLGKQGPATASAAVQRFVAPAPTATPLPVGTLTASISASIPPAVVGGAKAKASAVVTVTNPGTQTISGPVTVTLYVSLGQSLGGAVQLITSTPRLKLKAHARKALRLKLSSFPSLPMGSYDLIAEVTSPDGTSTGVAGPSLSISPPFVSTVVSNVVPALAPVAPGKKTSLTLSLQNQGNVPATGTASVAISASTESSGADGAILATVPLKVKLKVGRLGHYKLRFAEPSSLPAGRYYLALAVNVAALGDSIASDGMAVSALTLTVT